MPFVGIPDPEHKVASLYGQEFNIFKLGRMPEVVVVDKNGNLRLKHKGKFIGDIPSNKKILALLDEINEEEGGDSHIFSRLLLLNNIRYIVEYPLDKHYILC